MAPQRTTDTPIVIRDRRPGMIAIPRAMLEDVRLSYTARGVLCVLLATPDRAVTPADLVTSQDDHATIQAALEELRAAGYLESTGEED